MTIKRNILRPRWANKKTTLVELEDGTRKEMSLVEAQAYYRARAAALRQQGGG